MWVDREWEQLGYHGQCFTLCNRICLLSNLSKIQTLCLCGFTSLEALPKIKLNIFKIIVGWEFYRQDKTSFKCSDGDKLERHTQYKAMQLSTNDTNLINAY